MAILPRARMKRCCYRRSRRPFALNASLHFIGFCSHGSAARGPSFSQLLCRDCRAVGQRLQFQPCAIWMNGA
jgi:hypothetical protein